MTGDGRSWTFSADDCSYGLSGGGSTVWGPVAEVSWACAQGGPQSKWGLAGGDPGWRGERGHSPGGTARRRAWGGTVRPVTSERRDWGGLWGP